MQIWIVVGCYYKTDCSYQYSVIITLWMKRKLSTIHNEIEKEIEGKKWF